MITNGVSFQFGLGATFKRRDGQVVEYQGPFSSYTDKGSFLLSGYVHPCDLVEQLTLPYDAKPIELAVGQVWPDNASDATREIVFLNARDIAYYYRATPESDPIFLQTGRIDSFRRSSRIPAPAKRPKKKVITKLYIYDDGRAMYRGRSEQPQVFCTLDKVVECLGFIHGSEQEEEVEE